jgi:hypothetical protein
MKGNATINYTGARSTSPLPHEKAGIYRASIGA